MSISSNILNFAAAIIFLGITFGIIAIPFVFVLGMYKRGEQVLTRWAAGNGYRIIKCEHRKVLKGPYLFTSSNNQMIYHITVEDAYGNIRRAWVRCGSYHLGAWREVIDVRWV